MNKKEVSKQSYLCPCIGIVEVELSPMLGNTSTVSGGHNQGQVSGGGGDAKQGWFEEEESEGEKGVN